MGQELTDEEMAEVVAQNPEFQAQDASSEAYLDHMHAHSHAAIVRCAPGEPIMIARDGNRLALRPGPSRMLLQSCFPEEIPWWTGPDGYQHFPASAWFALQQVYDFIGRDESKQNQRGIFIDGLGLVYATDNYRVAAAPYADAAALPTVFMHDVLLKRIIKGNPPDAFWLQPASKLWLAYFTADGATVDYLVFSELLLEDPPDYASVFKMRVSEGALLAVRYHPAELRASLERILRYAPSHEDLCLVKVGQKRLRLIWHKAAEYHEEELAITVKPEAETSGKAQFYISPRHLLECSTKAEAFSLYPRVLRFRNKDGLDVLVGLAGALSQQCVAR